MVKKNKIRGQTRIVYDLFKKGYTKKEIAKQLNLKSDSVGNYLKRLRDYGYLVKVSYGKYKVLTNTPLYTDYYNLPKVVLEKKLISIEKLDERDVKNINSYCYFCGEQIVTDLHHIKMSKEKDNCKENLICLCPNHHAMLHRGNAELWYEGGHFFLNIFYKNVLSPFGQNVFIKRNLFDNPCKIQYDRENNDLTEAYQLLEFSRLELKNLISLKYKIINDSN